MSFVEFGALPAESNPTAIEPEPQAASELAASAESSGTNQALEGRLPHQLSEISRLVAPLEDEEALAASATATVDEVPAPPPAPQVTRNPFEEEFATEQPIPNEAKQLRAVLAALTQQSTSAPRHRTDSSIEPVVRSSHLPPADDRDMIVVSRGERSNDAEAPGNPVDIEDAPVSRGRARRLDYNQLFQQLRAGKP
jgi:hypothetical protein